MKTLLRLTFLGALTIFILHGAACGQILHCDKLQQLVKVAAADSTLSSIKGTAWDDSGSNYNTLLSLWDTVDDVHFQEISFDSTRHNFYYVGQLINEGNGKKEFSEILKIVQNCLAVNWSMEVVNTEYPVKYRFRSHDNHLIVDLFNNLGVINVVCYMNKKR
jgi:hypothetical protein